MVCYTCKSVVNILEWHLCPKNCFNKKPWEVDWNLHFNPDEHLLPQGYLRCKRQENPAWHVLQYSAAIQHFVLDLPHTRGAPTIVNSPVVLTHGKLWKRNKSTFSALLHPSVLSYIPPLNQEWKALVSKLNSKAFFSPRYSMLLVNNTWLLLTLLLRPMFKDSPFLHLSTSQTISTSQLKCCFFSLWSVYQSCYFLSLSKLLAQSHFIILNVAKRSCNSFEFKQEITHLKLHKMLFIRHHTPSPSSPTTCYWKLMSLCSSLLRLGFMLPPSFSSTSHPASPLQPHDHIATAPPVQWLILAASGSESTFHELCDKAVTHSLYILILHRKHFHCSI